MNSSPQKSLMSQGSLGANSEVTRKLGRHSPSKGRKRESLDFDEIENTTPTKRESIGSKGGLFANGSMPRRLQNAL